mmetsp:Transcript_136688/g.237720  ORF Transcript_136688/g.237720 Transcript_136688/m.237720 type:complete len:476 (-) Transcript_136688:185-1612(-)
MSGHKLRKERFTRGKRCVDKLPDASDNDVRSFPQVLLRFQKHLQSSLMSATARQYVLRLRRLFDNHRRAPEAMASQEYVAAVRGMGLPYIYSSSAQAFSSFMSATKENADPNSGTFRGTKRKAEASGCAKPFVRCNARTTKALAHLEDACAADVESIPEIVAGFKEHLGAKFPAVTAKQYLQIIQRLFRLHNKSPKAMASKAYLNAVRALKLRAAQVAAVKAFCKYRGVEVEDDIASARQRADSEARRRLAWAKQHGRPINDADVLAVLRIWGFSLNKERRNVLPPGVKSVYSATLGLIRDRRSRLLISRSTDRSENVMRLMCQWLQDQLGRDSFPFTSISINKGYAAAMHRDKGNEGPSATRALGDFQGGGLRYWHGIPAHVDVQACCEANSVLLDSRHGVVFFDGNCPHAVEEFAGERFSAVFFTSNAYRRVSPAVRNKLKSLGAQWPTERTLKSASCLVDESLAASELQLAA